MKNQKIDLTAYLEENVEDEGMRRILQEVALCGVLIKGLIQEANFSSCGKTNIHGEEQYTVELAANDILRKRFSSLGLIHKFVSEESKEIEFIGDNGCAFEGIVVDPIDGSSLLGTNLSVGTIVGVYKRGPNTYENFSPRSIVAAAYIVYGPTTTLVCATRNRERTPRHSVAEFVLVDAEQNKWAFVKRLWLRSCGKLLAPGGLESDWTGKHARFIEDLRREGYKLRYSGGLVPDLNQILTKGGGIYCYPALRNAPHGKLRLLCECQPLAFIAELAGGAATDGDRHLLNRFPDGIDERTPLYIGSRDEVSRYNKS